MFVKLIFNLLEINRFYDIIASRIIDHNYVMPVKTIVEQNRVIINIIIIYNNMSDKINYRMLHGHVLKLFKTVCYEYI